MEYGHYLLTAAGLPQCYLNSNTIERNTEKNEEVIEGVQAVPVTEIDDGIQSQLAEQALPVGTTLSDDQFTITEHLGAGGFGITYKAKDNVLGRTVVIKECFPDDFCVREGKGVFSRKSIDVKPIRSVVKMFMREARSLAKLRHPNIVAVHRIFEENGTAYMVLDLIDGQDLFDVLDKNRRALTPRRVKDILLQLLDAIEVVHKIGLLHRDISPDNILIEKDGTPVLIDFGAARLDATRHTRAVSSFMVVKEGYSPQEFYVAGSEQAPCSDLYALAATFYHVIAGRAPPNPQVRMMEVAANHPDPCVPLAGSIEGYDKAFLQAIDLAMQLHPGDRLQTAAKWRSMITSSGEGIIQKPKSKARSSEVEMDLELSLSRLVEETNTEVRRTSQMPDLPEVEAAPPKPESSRPEWVDEFNRSGLIEPEVAPEDEGYLIPAGRSRAIVEEFSDPTEDTPPVTEVAPTKRPRTESWIHRAAEKQDRIRSEGKARAEAAAEAAAEAERARKIEAGEIDPNYQLPPLPPVNSEPGRGSAVLGFGLYAGVILCCYAAFVMIYT